MLPGAGETAAVLTAVVWVLHNVQRPCGDLGVMSRRCISCPGYVDKSQNLLFKIEQEFCLKSTDDEVLMTGAVAQSLLSKNIFSSSLS